MTSSSSATAAAECPATNASTCGRAAAMPPVRGAKPGAAFRGFTQMTRYASLDSRTICSPSSVGSTRSQPSETITTTAPRATPRRPSRWVADRSSGRSVDLRRTLRAACRTGGDPIHWAHRRRGSTPRPIVLLADVSGSMQPYARIYLRVLQGAVIGARAQAYVFATRLTKVSGALATGRREEAIARALAHAPDTAGGTRIGEALKTFLDTDGRRGVARGAVVVVVSDGWERVDPSLLGEQMARLSRLAYRVIWVNPRKAAPGFAPLTGGMAAALPHVDAFVAGHSAAAVAELLDAITAQTRQSPNPTEPSADCTQPRQYPAARAPRGRKPLPMGRLPTYI